MKFKPGDKVICVKPKWYNDPLNWGDMEPDKIYTVIIHPALPLQLQAPDVVALEGYRYLQDADRFEKADNYIFNKKLETLLE